MPATLLDLASGWVDLLVRESLYVSVVFVVVFALSLVLRRRGPAIHLALWSLVFVRLVLPTDLAHPWSVGGAIERFRMLQAEEPIGNAIGGVDGELIVTESAPGFVGDFSGQAFGWRTGLALVWLVGFVIVGRRQHRRLAVFQKVIGRADAADQVSVRTDVERWRRMLGIRRSVRVVSSNDKAPPFTVGILRPVIFLPAAVVQDPESLEPVIAHEMAHVARFDALWLWLQHLVQAVYFFHPLVWIGGARLDQEREKLCDATVVAAGRLAARNYVGGLLNVLRLDLQGAGAPTMTARKRRIGMRIQNILDRDGGSRPQFAAALVVAFVVGVFVLPLAGNPVDASPIGKVGSAGAVAEPGEEAEPVDIELVNPLPGGRITRSWGSGHLDPFTGKEVFHRGIDLAAKSGTPIYVSAAGLVVVATDEYEPQPGAGTVVIVDHGNGVSTYYGHLASFEVEEGQEVSRGDAIARVGSTGKSTGPHLHFEVRSNDETLDPADFISDWK